jgi:hypothetical protein
VDKPIDGFGDGVELDGAHKRAEPRDSLFLQAVFTRQGREPLTLRVRNLSSGGLMADCTEPMTKGESIDAEIRGIGTVSGKVAWVGGNRFGMAFEIRVDPKLARKPVGTSAAKPTILVHAVTFSRRPGLRVD